jgi:hypothetical protein
VPKDGLPVQLLDSDKLGDLLAKAGVNDKSKVLVYSEGNNIPLMPLLVKLISSFAMVTSLEQEISLGRPSPILKILTSSSP